MQKLNETIRPRLNDWIGFEERKNAALVARWISFFQINNNSIFNLIGRIGCGWLAASFQFNLQTLLSFVDGSEAEMRRESKEKIDWKFAARLSSNYSFLTAASFKTNLNWAIAELWRERFKNDTEFLKRQFILLLIYSLSPLFLHKSNFNQTNENSNWRHSI